MVTLDVDATMTASLGLFLSKGVSRMPVIGEDVDEVIGVLYLKDVARVELTGQDYSSSSRRACNVSIRYAILATHIPMSVHPMIAG